jgi:hypothetical protein
MAERYERLIASVVAGNLEASLVAEQAGHPPVAVAPEERAAART